MRRNAGPVSLLARIYTLLSFPPPPLVYQTQCQLILIKQEKQNLLQIFHSYQL